MQALGNDFVMIDWPDGVERPKNDFFIKICNRVCGIGCDTVVVYNRIKSDVVTACFFNADGSEAEICGNAARCIGLLMENRFGLSECTIVTSNNKAYPVKKNDLRISVSMGKISLSLKDIGIQKENIDPLLMLNELELPDEVCAASCASIGNPHLVLFYKNHPNESEIESIGKVLEKHPLFLNRINVSFATIKTKNEIKLSVFERGVGPTLACGSGACATVGLAYLHHFVEANVLVQQEGGCLEISIDDFQNIFQSGPASLVFSGRIEI
jgi:diaminopimelate epimerase